MQEFLEQLKRVLGWLSESPPALQEDGLWWVSTVLREAVQEERYPRAEEIWAEIVEYHGWGSEPAESACKPPHGFSRGLSEERR